MTDDFQTVLEKYESLPGKSGKRAVFLTPAGGYLLYGQRFCSISDYTLDLSAAAREFHGSAVQDALFLGIAQGRYFSAGLDGLRSMELLFHVDLGEDGLLRGLLFAGGEEARFALFADEELEALYRLIRRHNTPPGWAVPPEEELRSGAEEIRRNDMRLLTSLYLHSKKWDGAKGRMGR